jgi:hypothetical protein
MQQDKRFTATDMHNAAYVLCTFFEAKAAFERTKSRYFLGKRASLLLGAAELVQRFERCNEIILIDTESDTAVIAARNVVELSTK